MAFVLPLLLLLLPSPAASVRRVPTGAQDLRPQPLKVVVSSTCAPDGAGDREMHLAPDSPLVLTHRIRLLPGSGSGCGQCDTDFAALRERIERLEKEVSDLREKCGGPDGCCSSQQSKGSVCTTVRPETDACPDDCSDQGRCGDGKCVCFPGFSGPDCSVPDCPDDCSSRGRCVSGVCVCDPGFSGPDCSVKACPENCSNRGQCVNGKCVCESGFSGPDCSSRSCPGDCSERGRCVNGVCVCDVGFTGPDCGTRICPGNCNARGRCVDGVCVCESGFTGPDCSSQSCPNDCSNKGRCVDGKCVCDVGFSGQDCSSKSCPSSCSNRGRCVRGRCVCRRGFTGPDCSQCQAGLTGDNCDRALAGVSRLSTSDITESSVTLSWTPAAVQYDSFLISFTSTKEPEQKVVSRIGGALTSFTQTGLAAGQQYSVSVSGEKDDVMGAESTAQVTTLVSGPTALRVVKSSSTSVVVQWEKPQGEIDRYVLSVAPNPTDGSRRPEMTLLPERDSARIDGLQPGRLYDLSLVAERDGGRSRPASAQAVPGNVSVPETRMSMRTGNEQEEGNNKEKTLRFPNATLFLRTQGLGKGEVGNSERTGNNSRIKPVLPVRPGQRRPFPMGRHGMLPKPDITRRPYSPAIKYLNASQMGVKGGIVVPSSNRSVTRHPLRANADAAHPVSGGKPSALTMKDTRSQKGKIGAVETLRNDTQKHTSSATPLPITDATEPTVTAERNLTAYINGTKCVRKVLVGYRNIHGNTSDGSVLSKNMSVIVGHVNGNKLLHKLLTGRIEIQPKAETSEARRSVKEREEEEEKSANATRSWTRRPETTLLLPLTPTPAHFSTSTQPENQHSAEGAARKISSRASSGSVPRPRHSAVSSAPLAGQPQFVSSYSRSPSETPKDKRPSWPSPIAPAWAKQPLVEVKVTNSRFPAAREIQDSTPALAHESSTDATPLPAKLLLKQDTAMKNRGMEASDLMPFHRTGFRASLPRRPNASPFQNRTRSVPEPPRLPSRGPVRRAFPSKHITRNNRTISQVSPVRPVKPASTPAKGNGSSVRVRSNAVIDSTNAAARRHSQIKQRGISQTGTNISQHGNSDRSLSTEHLMDNDNKTQESVLSETDGSVEHVRVKNATSTGFVLTWAAPEHKFTHFIITQTELGSENTDGHEGDGTTAATKTSLSGGASAAHEREAQVKSRGNVRTVLPGSARAHPVTNLSPRTRYSVSVFGKGPAFRSKTHNLVILTGPAPPSDLVFSDVTDSSFTVSWTKPKGKVSGFKVTHTHLQEGEPISVSVDSETLRLHLSAMSPGSTYEVGVMSLLGSDESDSVRDTVTTLPDAPTDLRVMNVTDSDALLLWRPALAAVDHYIITYSSAEAPGSGITVRVSGNAAEQQLQALRSSTHYSVSAQSRLRDLSSSTATAGFTTTGKLSDGPRDLKASQVTPRIAVLSWKPPASPITGYKLSYSTDGQEIEEVIVDPTVTELKLRQLKPSSSYTARLRADSGGVSVSTQFSTGNLRFPYPADCSQEQQNGALESGVVEVFPQEGAPRTVYCDMETDGGGWTVFQRRKDGKTDFFRSWREYSSGFGTLDGEFWMGNELLHNFTKSPVTLRIDLRAGDESVYARYSSFSVEHAKKHFSIRVSGYSGTAGDSMSYHNGRPFSTRDRDPQPFITRCAMSYRGGWWYKNCHEANLNGLYNTNTNHQGVIWTAWKGKDFSIPFTEMKFRPASFRP